jgi:hypothetical protein
VNTDVDPTHCGTCGNACGAGAYCNGGTCAPLSCTPSVIFFETFADNSQGWTLDAEWQIGPAVPSSPGSGGCTVGGDPAADHTPTADNGLAGVVIGGNAETVLHGFRYLTSPVIDTSDVSQLTLSLERWLLSDYTPFMQNHVEVFDGTTWHVLWASGPPPGIQDTSWNHMTFDLSPYANAALQIRIGFNIDSDGMWTCGQWSVDDIMLLGCN